MTFGGARAAGLAGFVVLGVLLLVPSTAAMATSATAGPCAPQHACGGHADPATSADAGRRALPQPCLHDPGCGGGAALGGVNSFVLLGVLASAGAARLWAARGRTLRPVDATAPGWLAAGRLFRPPRPSAA